VDEAGCDAAEKEGSRNESEEGCDVLLKEMERDGRLGRSDRVATEYEATG